MAPLVNEAVERKRARVPWLFALQSFRVKPIKMNFVLKPHQHLLHSILLLNPGLDNRQADALHLANAHTFFLAITPLGM